MYKEISKTLEFWDSRERIKWVIPLYDFAKFCSDSIRDMGKVSWFICPEKNYETGETVLIFCAGNIELHMGFSYRSDRIYS